MIFIKHLVGSLRTISHSLSSFFYRMNFSFLKDKADVFFFAWMKKNHTRSAHENREKQKCFSTLELSDSSLMIRCSRRISNTEIQKLAQCLNLEQIDLFDEHTCIVLLPDEFTRCAKVLQKKQFVEGIAAINSWKKVGV